MKQNEIKSKKQKQNKKQQSNQKKKPRKTHESVLDWLTTPRPALECG